MIYVDIEKISIGILGLILGAQILSSFWIWAKNRFRIFLNFIFYFSFVFIFGYRFYEIYWQYKVWLSGSLMKFFLPPYQSLKPVSIDFLSQILGPTLLAFLAAIIFMVLANFINKKSDERFFEKEEIEMFGLAVFLTGYPGFIIYIFILLLVFLLCNLAVTLYFKIRNFKELPRVSPYFLWVLTAVFAIIIKNWLYAKNLLVFFNL